MYVGPQGKCQPAERGKRSVLLSEMKHGLDQLREKVESLETKVTIIIIIIIINNNNNRGEP